MADYNTQKDHLVIREYGRNTQNLINHAKTIEDREQRQAYVEKIVDMILTMHPNTKNIDDYRIKVWSHVMQMADYKIDVKTPDNLPDSRLKRKPDKVNYPQNINEWRYYGRNVKTMINKALKMEDMEKKEAFMAVIGAYMKMSYKSWNRDNVNDEVIFEEFAKMTKGEMRIPRGTDIDFLVSPNKKKITGNNSSTSTNISNPNTGGSNIRNNNNKTNRNDRNDRNDRNEGNKNNPNKTGVGNFKKKIINTNTNTSNNTNTNNNTNPNPKNRNTNNTNTNNSGNNNNSNNSSNNNTNNNNKNFRNKNR